MTLKKQTVPKFAQACAIPLVLFFLAGCASASAQPWTSQGFDRADEKFTFAVFSDLTGGEREGIFEIAVQQLKLLRPELIISVGDLIEGDGDQANINQQWDSFDARAERASARVFYVGGNHDLLGDTLRTTWEERYGRRYYHFVYRNVLFLVLDADDHSVERLREIAELRREAMDIAASEGWDAFYQTEYYKLPENDAGKISAEQSALMQQAIADNPQVRWTFVFVHKAPWMHDPTGTFTEIETALSDRPYTLFHGHIHAYQYQQRNGRDYIRLATTGGVQLPEFGRSMDQVTLVTVDEDSVDIANLLMSGILDKTGHIPLGGDDVCFEKSTCDKEK
jgi:predicted phosphodiesterase